MAEFDKSYFDLVRQAQADGKPVAKYIKAILGRVGVTVIDPFTGQPTDIVLTGDPADEKAREDIIVTLWTQFEHEYFRRTNRLLLERGALAPFTEEIVHEISVNEVSDDVLRDALGKPFMAVKHLLEKFTSPAPVMRLLNMALEMNRPAGTVNAIKKRLSELQVTYEE